MEATKLLEHDHDEVTDLFAQYRKLGPRSTSTRRTLFSMIDKALDIHAKIEEELFYPAIDALRRGDRTRRDVIEAIEEHKIVKQLLEDLRGMDPEKDTIDFDAKMRVLMDKVEHHIDVEERDLFRRARKLMNHDDLCELGRELEIRRDDLYAGEDDRPSERTNGQLGRGVGLGYGDPGI